MPRQKRSHPVNASQKGTPFKKDDPGWGGFIECRMNEQDKLDFAVWSEEHAASMWMEFQDFISRGFKFSLSYDSDGDFFLACFTASGEDLIGIDLRCCLTARAPEWEQSLLLLLFKHTVMAGENWGSFRPAQNRFDRLG